MAQYLYILLVLACPLMMIWMMRGMHGHGHSGQSHGAHHGRNGADEPLSLEDLQRQREELDRQIREREWVGEETGDRSPERV